MVNYFLTRMPRNSMDERIVFNKWSQSVWDNQGRLPGEGDYEGIRAGKLDSRNWLTLSVHPMVKLP